MKKIIHVVGARPNFMKVAPVMEAIAERSKRLDVPVRQILVHTGQHYSPELSKILFDDLKLPKPDINLEVGSGSHGEQTGKVMIAFEEVLRSEQPDLMVVVGDVNSTIACALDAAKLGIRVAHVEAGLRSFDRSMPEEINRILTDQISDLLFTTEEAAADNLRREGISEDKIFFVGNVMIDTLLKHRDAALQRDVISSLGVTEGEYGVVTLHRPSNVDDVCTLNSLLEVLERIGEELPLVWPMHPRTRSKLDEIERTPTTLADANIKVTEPMGYLNFMNCVANSAVVLTDSGGVQEETTILRIPCITLRDNTERPVTITHGTNVLAGTEPNKIWRAFQQHTPRSELNGTAAPKYWDGRAAERIAQVLVTK